MSNRVYSLGVTSDITCVKGLLVLQANCFIALLKVKTGLLQPSGCILYRGLEFWFLQYVTWACL